MFLQIPRICSYEKRLRFMLWSSSWAEWTSTWIKSEWPYQPQCVFKGFGGIIPSNMRLHTMPELNERWSVEDDENERRSAARQREQTDDIDRAISPAGRVPVVGGSDPSSARFLAQRHSSRRDLPVPRAGLAD